MKLSPKSFADALHTDTKMPPSHEKKKKRERAFSQSQE